MVRLGAAEMWGRSEYFCDLVSSTPLAMQGQFANCSLLVFPFPQVPPPTPRYQEFPHPTLPHQLPCKHSQSYTTSSVVLEADSLEELGSSTYIDQTIE